MLVYLFYGGNKNGDLFWMYGGTKLGVKEVYVSAFILCRAQLFEHYLGLLKKRQVLGGLFTYCWVAVGGVRVRRTSAGWCSISYINEFKI